MKDKQDLEKDYGYTGADGACVSAKYPGQVAVKKVNAVPSNNGPQLMAAIAMGPIAVTVDAGQPVF